MKPLALKIVAFLAVIGALTYISATVAPQPMENADAGPAYALAL